MSPRIRRTLAALGLLVGGCGVSMTPSDVVVGVPFDISFPGGPDAEPRSDVASSSDANGSHDAADAHDAADVVVPPDAATSSPDAAADSSADPAPECSPGAQRCTGPKQRARCSADSRWTPMDGCVLATACHPPTGACAPLTCEPQSSRCASSFATQKCLPSGTG